MTDAPHKALFALSEPSAYRDQNGTVDNEIQAGGVYGHH